MAKAALFKRISMGCCGSVQEQGEFWQGALQVRRSPHDVCALLDDSEARFTVEYVLRTTYKLKSVSCI